MASNAVTISGMFGNGHTYFADSPVVINIEGMQWPPESPFKIVRLEVLYQGDKIGEFCAETGGQSSISFNISSALKAIWAGYTFSSEVSAAGSGGSSTRGYASYSLKAYTEYIDSTDGELIITESQVFPGGQCLIGYMTEMERARTTGGEGADASSFAGSNRLYGDASTKPQNYPERVGTNSNTSIVGVGNSGTTSSYYSPSATGGPDVLRDSQPYADFLFVNRRGAVETCSAQTFEAMKIEVETKQYGRVERPTFVPSRSLMAIASGGRKSWSMSSGGQTREWAEWWAMEFLRARQWWMKYPVGEASGSYVPVIVEPAKKSTGIYDRAKQDMPSVEFTVTMALEG